MNDLQFVDTDTNVLVASLIASYQQLTGRTLYPASPERLFILWVAQVLVQERALINRAAQRNIPRYADGAYLDALAEIFHSVQRLPASSATTTMRFFISETLPSAQLVPKGTRVTPGGSVFFATSEDLYIPPGELSATVSAVCQTVGTAGNGFVVGQISQCVDVYPYYLKCESITASAGGAERESDTNLYLRMRASEDTYSTAGPMGGYEYWAKTASSTITDVRANTPSAGKVDVYILTESGLPSTEILSSVSNVLNQKTIRPLTDEVAVKSPGTVTYNIDLIYYLPKESSMPYAEIETKVAAAIKEYRDWQTAKMGRDVNPSKLVALLMAAGVKRVALTAPVYTAVSDGHEHTVAQVAILGTESVTNGGTEDE